MRQKKKVVSVIVALILLLAIFAAGFTFARYYKKVETSAQGTIARWSFGSKNENTTIKLSDEKLAPGKSGSFEIDVDATDSEVGVDYEVLVTKSQNIPRNMKFSATIYDKNNNEILSSSEYDTFESLATNELKGNIPVVEGNQSRRIVVSWNWPFNENDETSTDNEDGTYSVNENGVSSLESLFNIEIIGRQAR